MLRLIDPRKRSAFFLRYIFPYFFSLVSFYTGRFSPQLLRSLLVRSLYILPLEVSGQGSTAQFMSTKGGQLLPVGIKEYMNPSVRSEFSGFFQIFTLFGSTFFVQPIIARIRQTVLQRARLLVNIQDSNRSSKKFLISFIFEDFSIQRK